jgi:predicted nucleotidyltransferase
MRYGLKEEQIENIKKVFSSNGAIDEVIIIGSRAKGNFKNGSDIDFVIKGDSLALNDILTLRINLDNLNLPYTFDILIYSKIQNPDIIEHIKRVGKIFFKRS